VTLDAVGVYFERAAGSNSAVTANRNIQSYLYYKATTHAACCMLHAAAAIESIHIIA